MNEAKDNREQDCRGPEPYSRSQGELEVATKQKLFEKSNHKEHNRPPDCVPHQTATVQRQAAERKIPSRKDQHHYAGNGQQPPCNALPKIPTKDITGRETIINERTPFDPAHHAHSDKQ